MTISEQPADLYAIAGRCPFAAIVQCDAQGKRFVLRNLDEGILAEETWALMDAGFTMTGGIVAINKKGEMELLAKSETFIAVVEQAAALFTVQQLQRLRALEDPRAQA